MDLVPDGFAEAFSLLMQRTKTLPDLPHEGNRCAAVCCLEVMGAAALDQNYGGEVPPMWRCRIPVLCRLHRL